MKRPDPNRRQRRSIRLRGYDYTLAGAYFVTICVENGRCLLGHINNDEMVLNQFGLSVNEEWQSTISRRDHVELDEYMVMPNHFHAIVWLTNAPELRATHASPLQLVISVRNRADWPTGVVTRVLGLGELRSPRLGREDWSTGVVPTGVGLRSAHTWDNERYGPSMGKDLPERRPRF